MTYFEDQLVVGSRVSCGGLFVGVVVAKISVGRKEQGPVFFTARE
jgi:hypothetical protein